MTLPDEQVHTLLHTLGLDFRRRDPWGGTSRGRGRDAGGAPAPGQRATVSEWWTVLPDYGSPRERVRAPTAEQAALEWASSQDWQIAPRTVVVAPATRSGKKAQT